MAQPSVFSVCFCGFLFSFDVIKTAVPMKRLRCHADANGKHINREPCSGSYSSYDNKKKT